MGIEPDPSSNDPSPWDGLRGRLQRHLSALAGLLLGYAGLAYVLVPFWWHFHEGPLSPRDIPKVTRTSHGIPGDPVNLTLVGTQDEVVRSMLAADWVPADPTTFRTGLRICGSVMLRRPYPQAPVSDLFLFGRRQDLAFQQAVGTSAKQRHHVRFWRSEKAEIEGRAIWLGAATFDRSVGLSHRTGQVTHHIAPEVDTERDKVIADLRQAGQLMHSYRLRGLGPTTQGRNGGGDRYATDGDVAVADLKADATASR
jgi:hypothetical protein